MSNKNIKPDELAATINEFLTMATEEYTEVMKDVIDDIAQGTLEETKRHITWHDKVYSDSFAISEETNTKRSKKKLWYASKGMHRLTHLLEFGHVTRNGTTRTRAYPHVEYGQVYVTENFAKELKERIEQCKF